MNIKKLISYIFLILFAINNTYATESLTSAKGILKVGTTGDFTPMTYFNTKENKYSGFDIDMAKSLAKYLKLKLVFVRTSWQNLSKDLKKGKFDIAMGGITATSGRNKLFLLSDPILKIGKVPLILKKNKEKFKTFTDIDQRGIKIVANNGGTNMYFALKKIKNADIIIVPENKMNFEYILNEKADVFFTDNVEAHYKEATNPKLMAIKLNHLYDQKPFVYLIPENNKKLLHVVNKWIKILKQNGQISRLMDSAIQSKY